MGVLDNIDWPDPMVISEKARNLKKRFTESYTEEDKPNDLNYIVAVSSGKAVSEEIPKQIGRRAGWASQQGANFVELLIENPAQLVMDEDMLINLSRQLDLHYNIHSSTSMAYGMSYRRGRGNGFDSAHEYTVKLLKAVEDFRDSLEFRGEAEDQNGHPRLYAINGHMAIAQFPSREERLAQDVSVDPFGEPIEDGKIYRSEDARRQLWEYIEHEILRPQRQVFQYVLDELDLLNEFQNMQRDKLLDKLIDGGYLPPKSKAGDYFDRDYSAWARYEIRNNAKSPNRSREDEQQIRAGERAEPQDKVWPGVGPEEYRDIESEAEDDAEEEAYDLAQDEVVDNEESMKDVMQIRSIEQEIWKESTILRHIMPRWMPHAEEPQIVQIWEEITGITTKDIDKLEKKIEEGQKDPREEENIIAAATGAYVWGHFTQVPPGYEQSLMAYLHDADVYWCFESHMAGPAENARIWKPKDMIEVVKAINATPVTVEIDGDEEEMPLERTRITIDMEHIATQKVDPMWVIDPSEEIQEKENYKGLDDGDGEYIMINHVTHPYITEEGHQHGPIRRGDIRVYRYIYKLVEKGMATGDLPTVVMYEIGGEKAETLFMLRLILNMIEHGIDPDQLEDETAAEIINKDDPDTLEEYMIQKFFGVTDTEVQHEWQEIHQHALDPLDDLLESAKGGHSWLGRAATEGGTRPEEWEEEEFQ